MSLTLRQPAKYNLKVFMVLLLPSDIDGDSQSVVLKGKKIIYHRISLVPAVRGKNMKE